MVSRHDKPTPPWASVQGETMVRVTYRDTDQMGHVYYANYLVWFEIGRTELLRQIGHCYRDWEREHGVRLPVASCAVEYRQGARYDDLVAIHTRIADMTRASVTFHYEVRRSDSGEVLATGTTRHPFVDAQGRVQRVAHRLLPELFHKD